MEEGKKSRRKHRSRHSQESTQDYVDREMAKAMKEMERAMKQARLAEEAGERAFRAAKDVPEGVYYTADRNGEGIKIIHQKRDHPGTVIHMQNVKNVQVGCNNNIVVNKGCKSPSRRGAPVSDEAADRRKDEKNDNEFTERVQALMSSDRELAREDIETTCQFVGKNWRRLLRQLNLDDNEIEEVEQDYRDEGLRQIIYQGLLTWSRRTGCHATVGVMAKALKKTEHFDALRNLNP